MAIRFMYTRQSAEDNTIKVTPKLVSYLSVLAQTAVTQVDHRLACTPLSASISQPTAGRVQYGRSTGSWPLQSSSLTLLSGNK